jgi:hypothetical protein
MTLRCCCSTLASCPSESGAGEELERGRAAVAATAAGLGREAEPPLAGPSDDDDDDDDARGTAVGGAEKRGPAEVLEIGPSASFSAAVCETAQTAAGAVQSCEQKHMCQNDSQSSRMRP